MRLIPDGRDVIAPRRRRIEIRARGFSNLGALFWASRVVVHALARRWQVGNTHSIDYMPALKDKFSIRQQSAEQRREFANRVVAFLQDHNKPWSGTGVVGDVSWVHTQYMREMLEANQKVVLVFQYREECPTPCLPATAPPSFRPPAPPSTSAPPKRPRTLVPPAVHGAAEESSDLLCALQLPFGGRGPLVRLGCQAKAEGRPPRDAHLGGVRHHGGEGCLFIFKAASTFLKVPRVRHACLWTALASAALFAFSYRRVAIGWRLCM